MLPAAPTVAVGLLTAALAGTSVAAADDDDARAAAAASAGDDAALVCEDAIVCRRFHQKLKGFNLYLASSTSSGCVTLQGGNCNFNLWTLGILNLLALGALGPGLDFGIWELAKV